MKLPKVSERSRGFGGGRESRRSFSDATYWPIFVAMQDNRFHRLGRAAKLLAEHSQNAAHAIADWWSFQLGTLEIRLDRTPETSEDRAIRLWGEPIKKAFPWIDFDRPGARTTPR